MLSSLNIIDLAVVERLNLELEPGMSVLTGETGAGKSILLTALGLALGDRADSGYVRAHAKRAEIHLEFNIRQAPQTLAWLQENELDDEEHCLIRRTVSDDGRSKAYINNRPVNLQTLQALSKQLVEIHGQHAHLTLLDSEEQRRLIDAFAQNEALLEQLNQCQQQWRKLRREWRELQKSGVEQQEREELLRYQLEELRQLDLEHYDYAALAEQHHKMANLGKILASGQQQLDVLYDSDEQSVSAMLAHAQRAMQELSHYAPELNVINEMLAGAEIQIAEAAQQLRRFLDNQEADPRQLDLLEQQLASIQSLSRKHKTAPEQLPGLAGQLAAELHNISHGAERLETLERSCGELERQYAELAARLSARRRDAGETLQHRISAAIKELGMPHGEFIVAIQNLESAEPQTNGLDRIEFLVCTNPGLPAKPLAKIASGGELSRISLAIQVTVSCDKSTPTMIFDEVDAGIGGGIAEIVGQKLHRLSHNRQVLCVTHLPQVAAQADQHLYVSKNQQAAVTSSSVRRLTRDERIEELARMLGGVTITENTLAHAQEMLERGGLSSTPPAG